jgi:imidazolonepropionase-like amidohydrolase
VTYQNNTNQKYIDGDGKFIYPGLIDAHCHLQLWIKLEADLRGTSGQESLAFSKDKPACVGNGWDQNDCK